MNKVMERPCKWKLLYDERNKRWLDWDGDKTLYEYNMQTRERSTREAQVIENFVFDATIKPTGSYRGRSAAGFTFEDVKTGDKFVMRIAKVEELLDALAKGSVVAENGGFQARYTFYKQGANYSLGLYNED